MIDLKLPKINADTTEGQMAQVKSFLYQHVEELDYALGQIQRYQDETNNVIEEINDNDNGYHKVLTKINQLGRTTTEIKVEAGEISSRVETIEGDYAKGTELRQTDESIRLLAQSVEDDYATKGELEVMSDEILAKVTEELDGEVTVYTIDYEPNNDPSADDYYLNFYPALDFTHNLVCGLEGDEGYFVCDDDTVFTYTDDDLKRHARSVAFYEEQGTTYRFMKVEGEYIWNPVSDGDFGIAMKRIGELQVRADRIQGTVEEQAVSIGNNARDIADAKSQITQTADSIRSEVSNTYQTKDAMGNYFTAEETVSAIDQSAKQISLSVSKSYQPKGDYATETWVNRKGYLTVDSEAITGMVSKTDYNGNTVASLINQSADGVKILAKHLDIAGAVTFSTFDATTQAYINGIGTSASNAQRTADSADEKADNIREQVFYGNTTYIDGGKIYTHSIDASAIKTENLTANAVVVTDEIGNVVFSANATDKKVTLSSFEVDNNSIRRGALGANGSVWLCSGSGSYARIGGSENINGWCFTAGNQFGVLKDGTVYASNIYISDYIWMTYATGMGDRGSRKFTPTLMNGYWVLATRA